MPGSTSAAESKCTCLGRFVQGEWTRDLHDPACHWHGNTTEETPRYKGQENE